MYISGMVIPSFVNLVKLSIESNTRQGWQVLPDLLNKSPKLETLVLKVFVVSSFKSISRYIYIYKQRIN